jgi:putative ABC transport system substrate-binding protein
VAAGVDVIWVGGGNQAILAAKGVTTTIPIAMPYSVEPVETGIITSLARPGGNVTGLQWEDSGDIGGKKVQLFKQLVPTASRMAVVGNPTVRAPYWPSIRTAALAVRMEAYAVDYSSGEELDRALATVLKDRPSAIWFGGDAIASPRKPASCDFALKNHFPTLTSDQTWPQVGCLFSYGPDMVDAFRRSAIYVDKIFKGAKPGDLPIEKPTKYKLVINGKTAKALGLTIPQSLLQQADQVIE